MKKKVILQSIFITFIILITNLTALASLTSICDGDINNLLNGWSIDYILSLHLPSFYAGDGNATGNTVNISGGNFTSDAYIYGGYSLDGNTYYTKNKGILKKISFTNRKETRAVL